MLLGAGAAYFLIKSDTTAEPAVAAQPEPAGRARAAGSGAGCSAGPAPECQPRE